MNLDLDKIEEELKQISPWPWDYRPKEYSAFLGEMFFEVVGTRPNENGDVDLITVNRVELNNAAFIAKAPETIAALVKELRELREFAYEMESASKELLDNLVPIFNACGMDLPASYFKLKRGSDEL